MKRVRKSILEANGFELTKPSLCSPRREKLVVSDRVEDVVWQSTDHQEQRELPHVQSSFSRKRARDQENERLWCLGVQFQKILSC